LQSLQRMIICGCSGLGFQRIISSIMATTPKNAPGNALLNAPRNAQRLQHRVTRLNGLVSRWSESLRRYQNARLATGGLFFLALIILTRIPRLHLEAPVILAFFAVFFYLVKCTQNVQRHLDHLKRFESFTERQRLRCLGQPSGRAWEEASRDSQNLPLIRDLGLVGSHSIWTLMDETLTDGGRGLLLSWLSEKPRPAAEIRERQKRVQELRGETWFYTRLTLAADAKEFRLSSSQVLEFLKNPFVGANFPVVFGLTFAAWILAIVGAFNASHLLAMTGFTSTSPSVFGTALIFIFAFINFASLQQAGSIFKKGEGLSHHLSLLAPVFAAIEKRAIASAQLRSICPVTTKDGPAKATRRLNAVLGFLGTEANPLIHLIINVLTPWTVTASFFLERRRRDISASYPNCLRELAELEALGSLLLLDHYQTQNYPSVEDDAQSLSVRGVFHPLLDRTRAVSNDFTFPTGKTLGLLTGSNMSGKSTFLRTLGVNQILANIGAPVFAEEFKTSPRQVETCIEVSDSLRDGYSYFYAEVRRLKHILEAAEKPASPILYLIDEIFRGTNNRERQVGSRAVIRTLAKAPHAIGFISTHDLELTSLEDKSPALLNLHFREDIDEKGTMVFSYHLRPGPCPTTNALRIMVAEGIRIEE
jgi:hypothetical protein